MKPTVTFVYDLPPDYLWRDGLFKALQVLEQDFTIQKHNIALSTDIPQGDLVVGWGSFGSRVDLAVSRLECQKALCIAGNINPPTTALKYDVLFYETAWYRPTIDFHPRIIKAFGVNTDIFRPVKSELLFRYIGAGCLATWKRWEKILEKKGNNIVIGDYQKDNETESAGIALTLLKGGCAIANQMNPELLAYFVNASSCAFVPSTVYGGGERFVWEARACGKPVEIMPDNPKLQELCETPVKSYEDYARKLREGFLLCS